MFCFCKTGLQNPYLSSIMSLFRTPSGFSFYSNLIKTQCNQWMSQWLRGSACLFVALQIVRKCAAEPGWAAIWKCGKPGFKQMTLKPEPCRWFSVSTQLKYLKWKICNGKGCSTQSDESLDWKKNLHCRLLFCGLNHEADSAAWLGQTLFYMKSRTVTRINVGWFGLNGGAKPNQHTKHRRVGSAYLLIPIVWLPVTCNTVREILYCKSLRCLLGGFLLAFPSCASRHVTQLQSEISIKNIIRWRILWVTKKLFEFHRTPEVNRLKRFRNPRSRSRSCSALIDGAPAIPINCATSLFLLLFLAS